MPRNGLLQKVFPRERKSAYAIFRVTPGEKAAIREAARSVGKTTSAYLLGLHRHYTGSRKAAR